MALHLCPVFLHSLLTLVPSQQREFLKVNVFLLLSRETFVLPSSWPDVFSHVGCLGFWGAALWVSPSAACSAKPLPDGASQSWCNPADFTAAAFPHLFY